MASVTVWERTATALSPPGLKQRMCALNSDGNVWYCKVQLLRLWEAVTEQGMQQRKHVDKRSVYSKCSFLKSLN